MAGTNQQTSGERMHLQAGEGLSLYARDGGITAVANAGPLQLQSRGDQIQAHALQGMQFSAENGEIVIAAPMIRLVAADGSFLPIGGAPVVRDGDRLACGCRGVARHARRVRA
jgi:type VI secretion system secreted protein VgrG